MEIKEELSKECYVFLEKKVPYSLQDLYKKRLKEELIHIEVQDEFQYFLDLYKNNKKYANNENNLIVPWLLEICNDFDVNQESSYKMGELPDVDIDFLPQVRDYLKNEWAVKEFGKEFVCNIGNYGTFGLKSSFIDMARVHGYDRGEIIKITKQISLKDDDGNSLSFDKALEIYPELDIYCKKYPDVATAVQKIVNRNRSMGKHAAGLIISSVPISDFVPLAKNAKDETCVSSWVEGLSGQDLGPVGLIKMDLLVIDVLYQLAYACKLIKERHKIVNISAKINEWDWSDDSYQNDPKCLEMASNGDLKGIFQFDSDGIRNLAKKSCVSSFSDLVTLNALYRPGCLDMGMDQTFAKRKTGEEEYEIHPLLEPYLKNTYGVMVFQEQIMQILNVAGDIPLRDCYQVVKAISKKKISAFIKYKEKFIENGQVKLQIPKEEVQELFEKIQAFSEYGFNKSHAASYSMLASRQIYLKTYYPLEFYCALLFTEKSEEKSKIYAFDAFKKGILVKKLDLNLSKENYSIYEKDIYTGFSNIKGIGEEKAQRVVASQPYSDFFDFLNRFGVDAHVLKPLISLGVFKDDTKENLSKFWLKHCYLSKKIKGKERRLANNLLKIMEKLKNLLPQEHHSKIQINSKWISAYVKTTIEVNFRKFTEIQKKFLLDLKKIHDSVVKVESKKNDVIFFNKEDLENVSDDSIAIDDDFFSDIKHEMLCELKYYGFVWETNIQKSVDYTGSTLDLLKENYERGAEFGIVECEIEIIERKKSKKDTFFYQVTILDGNGERAKFNVWKDDYEIFNQELRKGNLIKVQLRAPTNGFPTYTLKSLPYEKRNSKKHSKQNDFRIVEMTKNENRTDD